MSSSPSSSSQSNLALEDLLRNLLTSKSSSSTTAPMGYDMVTANPPFLPVPSGDTGSTTTDEIAARHGLFSAGGSSGEAVLAAILALSRQLLKPNGHAAVVSEFFFQKTTMDRNSSDILLERLRSYWSSAPLTAAGATCCHSSSRALLLTNQHPIAAQQYAERRADSPEEVAEWRKHLQREHMATCSPGLLYVTKTTAVANDFVWNHVIVPKSNHGSIWTPSNPEGVQFTQTTCADFFQWPIR